MSALSRSVFRLAVFVLYILSGKYRVPTLSPPSVSRKEDVDRRVGVLQKIGFGAALIVAAEHGFVDGYPQQQADEVVGGKERIIEPQQLAFGKLLKTACQCLQHALEAPLEPKSGDVRQALGVGDDQPP